jgi:hypothetical protein
VWKGSRFSLFSLLAGGNKTQKEKKKKRKQLHALRAEQSRGHSLFSGRERQRRPMVVVVGGV